MTRIAGAVRKLQATLADPVAYTFIAGDATLPLSGELGRQLRLSFTGIINCVHCNRVTKKSFNQGYCYPCFRRLAACDSCIVSPEKCHFAAGTCREPEWGEANCNIEHVVYLANTSGIKVGITRGTQVPTRWIDQGAVAALPVARVATRHLSGLLEVALGRHVSDKTVWQAMVKGDPEPVDLALARDELGHACADAIDDLRQRFGLHAVQWLDNGSEVAIRYPVLEWPQRATALNLDKTPDIAGRLMGIKGQYLLLDTGVINIRKYGGYNIELTLE